jgi:large subunit ribosomal protein L13
MRTFLPNIDKIERKWWVVDARDEVLGRMASKIALILQGKRKRTYTRHIDVGDFVVVVNAEKVRLTGDKLNGKIYYRHTGYPGGIKSRTAGQMLEKFPERVIQLAVKRMLPRNKLGSRMLKRLKVYAGSDHPHSAQDPETLDLATINDRR